MYIKKNDIEMLEKMSAYIHEKGDHELAYDLDCFISHAQYDAQKMSLKAVESMRKYRENNPEKAKEYQRNYMRKYNRKKKYEKMAVL